MALNVGDTLLQYRIVEKIGEGGMGSVWRALDTQLDREVAVKVLPDAFTQDPERLARFEREAKVLASLNHPNIAAVYGFHETAGVRFIVLELVQGEDLAERLSRGAMPQEETLEVAKQIAEALEAAHARGVIHRDLKPANIKRTPEGKVKVLDFGLAKAMASDPQRSGADAAHSPTITSAGTMAGMILGTAAYMAPEQARGRPVDRRADLWAFGAVLFEMLTGRQAFAGESVSDVLAKVLQSEPDWDLLPRDLPPSVIRVLRRCLTKDTSNRLHDAADARIDLQDRSADRETRPVAAAPPAWRRVLPWAACAVLAIWAGVASIPRPTPPVPIVQFDVLAPSDRRFGEFTLSPDGSTLAFVASSRQGSRSLWIRRVESRELQELPGTEGASFPFWSPDSRHVGFFAQGKLRRIDLESRTTQTVADAPNGRGGAWSADDTILFTPSGEDVLYVVPASGGGTPVAATQRAEGESTHRFPHFVAGTRRFVYAAHSQNSSVTRRYLGALDSKTTTRLPDGLSEAYAPPGYLLLVREDSLYAQKFDADSGKVTGEPTPLADGISNTFPRTGRSAFSVSDNGVLAYLREPQLDTQFRWFDRNGRALETIAPPGRYYSAKLSRDGRSIAYLPLRRSDGALEIQLLDLARGTSRSLEGEGIAVDGPLPSWSHDGKSIVYPTDEGISRQGVSRGGAEAVLRRSESDQADSLQALRDIDQAADGSFLVFSAWDPTTDYDLWILPLDRGAKPRRLENANRTQGHAQVSPDSRWLVYDSNESGRFEVYVRSVEPGGRKWMVSTGGGAGPMWSADGGELFYISAKGEMMAVSIDRKDGELEAGLPTALFKAPEAIDLGSSDSYDFFFDSSFVATDGKRFLFQVAAGEAPPRAITVVMGWERRMAR